MTNFDLAKLLQYLETSLESRLNEFDHAQTFSAWMLSDRAEQAAELKALADNVSASGVRQSSQVATLGFALQVHPEFLMQFQAAFNWLKAREFFTKSKPLTFESDGIALVGVALGIMKLPEAEIEPGKKWLSDLMDKTLDIKRPSNWNESLIAAADLLLRGPASAHQSFLTPDLKVALSKKSGLLTNRQDFEQASETISQLRAASDGVTRASTQIVAINYMFRNATTIQIADVTLANLGTLLQGLHRSFRRWVWETSKRTKNSAIAKWDIENEYHLQDFLWAVLAPIFPDLDDEEWLVSLGQHHPRADLAIPSLEVIIEAKFIRNGKKDFVNIIKEVAADASTYLRDGGRFKYIYVVVWDDMAVTEEHEELKQGLLAIKGVIGAVILPRPSKMKRST